MMKKWLIIIILAYSGLAWGAVDFEKHFAGFDGCFILLDLKKDKKVFEYNKRRCEQRLPACSTFKIPLALMAFDSGAIQDEKTAFEWDKTEYPIVSWNRDHTAQSWMKDSVVWFSQRLTPLIGEKRIKKYLSDFKYGNKDISGGLTIAWLTRAPFMKVPPNPTLLISAREQARFLSRFWKGKLSASEQASDLVKKITFIETSPSGYALHGKTGSGFLGKDGELRLGWFIGHLQRGSDEFVAVVSVTDSAVPIGQPPYAGAQAREIMKSILTETGHW